MTPRLTNCAFFALLVALLIDASISKAQQPSTAPADQAAKTLSLASIFSDHMVLQREVKLPIWGKAAPGAKVTVQLGETKTEAAADEAGKWRVHIEPLKSGGEPLELTVTSGDESINLGDILVGEVWIASGQSNMEWPVTASDDPEQEVAAARYPEIRIIDVPNVTADEPADSFESPGWKAVTPETIGNFSAVAYFFGRDLHEQLDVPIGLIGCNWGGTPMEAWTSREALESSETFKEATAASFAPPSTTEVAEERKARAAHLPARLFNGMLAPVIPYGIRGAIWYQGESNAGRHQQYAELSKLMVTDWRTRFGLGDFPFLLVQLAAFDPGGQTNETWPPLREAQLETLQLPNTGMAVTTDVGNRTDIHPKDKQTVGKRLALAARAAAYGEDIVYSGPVYRTMEVADGEVRLAFDHVGGGLNADGELRGFEIAGADGKFVPAKASIEGQQIVVSSEAVAEPKTVRYNWTGFPDGNLFNAEGLPATPFRTSKPEAAPAAAPPAAAAAG
jgi:sialate O-acetylesterase